MANHKEPKLEIEKEKLDDRYKVKFKIKGKKKSPDGTKMIDIMAVEVEFKNNSHKTTVTHVVDVPANIDTEALINSALDEAKEYYSKKDTNK